MIPIVSIVAKSSSGKTTLLEGLIAELKQRGYRLAAIKHSAHGFDLDHPGTDSWQRYRGDCHASDACSYQENG